MFKKVSSLTLVVGLVTTLNFSHGEVYGMETQEKEYTRLTFSNEMKNTSQDKGDSVAGKISYSAHINERLKKNNHLMADHDLYRFMKNPEKFVKKPTKPKISKKTILETEHKNTNPLMADHDLYRFMNNRQEFMKNSKNNFINIIATSDDESDIDSGEAPNDLLALNNSKKRKWS